MEENRGNTVIFRCLHETRLQRDLLARHAKKDFNLDKNCIEDFSDTATLSFSRLFGLKPVCMQENWKSGKEMLPGPRKVDFSLATNVNSPHPTFAPFPLHHTHSGTLTPLTDRPEIGLFIGQLKTADQMSQLHWSYLLNFMTLCWDGVIRWVCFGIPYQV
jgi:hypothetical protein